VVAASGPSLTSEICAKLPKEQTIAVSDVGRLLMPDAAILYSCDAAWWKHHRGAPGFRGERWSSHGSSIHDNKREVGQLYGLNLIAGRDGQGFSSDPTVIHYGSNSGFQAVNLALNLGAEYVVLVGFDMRGGHFFGAHPRGLRNSTSYRNFITAFERAARRMPDGVRIVNATPNSALRCFPMVDLDEALQPEYFAAGLLAAPD